MARRLIASVIQNPDVDDVASWPQIERAAFTGAAGGSTQVITVQTSIAEERMWNIRRIVFKRLAGTGATYTLRIGEDSTWTNGDQLVEVFALPAQAVAVQTNHQPLPPVTVQADATGRIYIKPTWDAAADNTSQGWLDLEPVLS